MTDTTQGAATASLAGGGDTTATMAASGATATSVTTAQSTGVQPRKDPGAVAADWSAPDWAKDLPAEDLGYLEKRHGLSDPKALFKSYRELEKTLSSDKIILPKDDAKPEEWDGVYNKLGRPESHDKYVAPKDADANMFKALAPDLHGAGLNQKQVDRLSDSLKKFNDSQMAELETQWLKDQDTAQAKLEKEWGSKTPQEVELNRRAMRALGISVEDATNYMRNGAEKFLRLLNVAGHMIAEDNSGNIQSDETLGFGLTPNRASAELQEMRANKDFMARVYAGEPSAKAKYNRLVTTASESGLVRRTIKGSFKQTS